MLFAFIFFMGFGMAFGTRVGFSRLLPYHPRQVHLLPTWEIILLSFIVIHPLIATAFLFRAQDSLHFAPGIAGTQQLVSLYVLLTGHFILSAMSATVSQFLFRAYRHFILKLWYGTFFCVNMFLGAVYLYAIIGIPLVNYMDGR